MEKEKTPNKKRQTTEESFNNKIDSPVTQSGIENMSYINRDEINESNNYSISLEDDKNKNSKYETNETSKAKESTTKKRKLVKKINASYLSSDRSNRKDILNETNLVKIDVSAISVNEKDDNFVTTNGYCVTSEERLRNLVKKCKRTPARMKKNDFDNELANTQKSIINVKFVNIDIE